MWVIAYVRHMGAPFKLNLVPPGPPAEITLAIEASSGRGYRRYEQIL